jgi:hypothetical protein
MATEDRPGGTDPPEGPGPRNRRVHRTSGDTVWRRTTRGTGMPATGKIPQVPDGQAAPADAEATDAVSSVQAAPTAQQATRPAVQPATTPPLAARTQPTPASESDWMAVARQEAERARHQDAVATAWAPGGDPDDLAIDLTASPSLVRPYARTGGRTIPVRDLDLEALVRTTLSGKEASTSPWLTPEHTTIIELCSGTVSVAEIAARLAVPLGVARVIIADMVDLGLVEVMKTSAAEGDERDPDFLRRVLSGLQRL